MLLIGGHAYFEGWEITYVGLKDRDIGDIIGLQFLFCRSFVAHKPNDNVLLVGRELTDEFVL